MKLSSYFALGIVQQTDLLSALMAQRPGVLSLTDDFLLSLIGSAFTWTLFLFGHEVDSASLP